MGVKADAMRDASEYAQAHLAYGEGAGVRRRLIDAKVHYRADRDPIYNELFWTALERQDQVKNAKLVRRQRRRTDAGKAVNKNARAVISGKHENMSTALLVVAAAGYVAHRYGYDKKIINGARNKWRKFRGQPPVHIVTNI